MKRPHYDLIIAWANGANIQVWKNEQWQDRENPAWIPQETYRIEPETVKIRLFMHEDYNFLRAITEEQYKAYQKSFDNDVKMTWLFDWIDTGKIADKNFYENSK